MATYDSFEAEPAALEDAEPVHRFIGILAATGIETASAGVKKGMQKSVIQRDCFLIDPYEQQDDSFHAIFCQFRLSLL